MSNYEKVILTQLYYGKKMSQKEQAKEQWEQVKLLSKL